MGGVKTESSCLIYKCNKYPIKYFRGGVRVVMRWSAKPFTRVRFSPTSPKIPHPLKLSNIQMHYPY